MGGPARRALLTAVLLTGLLVLLVVLVVSPPPAQSPPCLFTPLRSIADLAKAEGCPARDSIYRVEVVGEPIKARPNYTDGQTDLTHNFDEVTSSAIVSSP